MYRCLGKKRKEEYCQFIRFVLQYGAHLVLGLGNGPRRYYKGYPWARVKLFADAKFFRIPLVMHGGPRSSRVWTRPGEVHEPLEEFKFNFCKNINFHACLVIVASQN